MRHILWTHFLILICFSYPEHTSGSNCPERCTCRWINGLPTADCSNLNLTRIPADIPPNVLVLTLTGNHIRHVQNITFLRHNLVHLIKLDLSYCNIGTIDSSAFTGMSNLRELNLDGNSFSQLPSAIYSDIRNLRVLSLRYMLLKTIPNFAFDQLNQLETLDMQSSQINHIEQEGFRGLENLRSLQLNGNQLRRLTLSTLITLKSLQQLDLHNNPWNCNCHVRDVSLWMRKKKVGSGFHPTCTEPAEFRGLAWDQVPIPKFACAPEILTIEAFNILPGKNISIECAVFGDPLPLVMWHYNDVLINATNTTKYETHSQNITTHFVHILIIRNASEADGGNYQCKATNWAGNTTGELQLFQSSGLLTIAETTILLITLLISIGLIICMGVYYVRYKRRRPVLLATLWKNHKTFLGAPDKFRDVTYFKTCDAMPAPPTKPEEAQLLLIDEKLPVPNKETSSNVAENENRSSDAIMLSHDVEAGNEILQTVLDKITTYEEDKDSGIQHEEDNSVRNDSSNENGICTPQDIFTDSDHDSIVKPRTVTFSPNTCVYIESSLRRSPAPTQQHLRINCLPGYDPYLGTAV